MNITSPESARYESAVMELPKLLCKMAAGSSQAQASVSSLLNEAIRILTEQQPEQPVLLRSERVAENFR